MSGHIAEAREQALHQHGQASLFRLLPICLQAVKRHDWARVDTARAIHKVSPVTRQAGSSPQLVGYAFARFEHGVEIVLLQQLRSTEAQHVRVNTAGFKTGSEVASASRRFI